MIALKATTEVGKLPLRLGSVGGFIAEAGKDELQEVVSGVTTYDIS